MVRSMGLEPIRLLTHALKRACLPIPARPQTTIAIVDDYEKSVNTFSKTLVKDPLHISEYRRLFYGYGLDMKLFPPYYFSQIHRRYRKDRFSTISIEKGTDP